MEQPTEAGSLANIPISPYGGRMEVSGKQGDLTPLLVLAKEAMPEVEIDQQITSSAEMLLTYLARAQAPHDRSFFTRCAARIRQWVRGDHDATPPPG